MRELAANEIAQVAGGDEQTYSWGRMVGGAARSFWKAMKDYAASSDSSTDVIV